jgi:hypothetical protein
MLKVYMAKLAVLISMPRMVTTHCPASWWGLAKAEKVDEGETAGRAALHGVEWSERRTPFSRASCSRVTGMKEPIPQTTKTSAAHPYM